MNKKAVIIGLLVFLLGTGINIAFGLMVSDSPVQIVAAGVDFPAGTKLSEIDPSVLVSVSVALDYDIVMTNYLTMAQFEALANDGGVLISDVRQTELLRLANVASPNNPLGITDPGLNMIEEGVVSMTIDFSGLDAPMGLSVGDTVNFILAVGNNGVDNDFIQAIPSIQNAEQKYQEEKDIANQTVSDQAINQFGLSEEELAAMTDEELWEYAQLLSTTQETPDNEVALQNAKQMLEYYLNVVYMNGYAIGPLAKTIVRGARVTSVICEDLTNSAMNSSTGIVSSVCVPEMASFLIPEEYSEDVAMAAEAGQLVTTVNSPLTSFDSHEAVTDGAIFAEFIKEFYQGQEIFDFDSFMESANSK